MYQLRQIVDALGNSKPLFIEETIQELAEKSSKNPPTVIGYCSFSKETPLYVYDVVKMKEFDGIPYGVGDTLMISKFLRFGGVVLGKTLSRGICRIGPTGWPIPRRR